MFLQLTASTYQHENPSSHPVRLIQPEDFIDLGQFFAEATCMHPHPALQRLSAWIDHMVEVFQHKHGTVLDGCSFVSEGRTGILGAIIIVKVDHTPRIWNLATAPMFIHYGLIKTLIHHSLTALARAGYPTIHAASIKDSIYTQVLNDVGFHENEALE